MTKQPAPERLTGTAVKETVRSGTASEHEAVVLHTTSGERLILQRLNGNPFSDPETQALAGKTVSVEGYRLGDILRYTSAEASDAKGKG